METPKSWAEVSVGAFSKIQAAISLEKDELEQSIMILTILKGESVNALTLGELGDELIKISFVRYVEIGKAIHAEFKVGERTFRSCIDITKITAGQYIDLVTFCKGDVLHNIHNIMAVLCDEWIDGNKVYYSGDVHQERAQLFYDNLSIEVAYPQALFFCDVWANLIPVMEISLALRQKKMTEILERSNRKMLKSQTRTMSNGAGMLPLITSAGATGLNGNRMSK